MTNPPGDGLLGGDLLDHVREQTAALAELVERHPDAFVPPCPGWVVRDVGAHVGRVHRLFAAAVRDGATARPEPPAEAPGDGDLPAWLRAGVGELLAALAAADPQRPVWNWTATPQPPAWVVRRMAHETAVHRWDAAAGAAAVAGAARVAGLAPEPLPDDLATDGVDEFLDVMLAHRTEPWQGDAVTVVLERVDGPERWRVGTEAGRSGVTVERGEGRGSHGAQSVVRATASDLLLLLWRRVAPGEVELEGDREAAARLLGWPHL